MRKPKRDDGDRTSEDFRTFSRVCLMVICIFVTWGILYMPLRTTSHVPLPVNLSWMVKQRILTPYILPDNITHLLLPKPQCDGRTFIVTIVCSAVTNLNARMAIRNSWMKYAEKLNNVRVFFLLGKSLNFTHNAAVIEESAEHMDIIQQDFHDTYNNLTIKSMMMLKWVGQNCANAQYVMKTDDDMFVNLPNLFRVLKAKTRKRLLLGCLIKGATPVKDWNSKWYVPDEIFSGHVYPPYLSGTGYVMSQDVVHLLYGTALSTPFFYLEDIFITGICAKRAGLTPLNNDGFKFYKRKNDTCLYRTLITAHKMTPKELLEAYKNVRNPSLKCKG